MNLENHSNYIGKILNGPYSRSLKDRLERNLAAYQAYDETGNPALGYVAAWKDNDRTIWYEFIGRDLLELLGCPASQASEVIRQGIVERRVYTQEAWESRIRQEILQEPELTDSRADLRREVKRSGTLEAVYKLILPAGRTVWLKDRAAIERAEEDRIFLSLGTLMPITREMEAAEERERLVKELQAARSEVKQLSGLLPICAHCKKIRDDQGYWNQLEEYFSRHGVVNFTHGICPACAEKLYPTLYRPDFARDKKEAEPA